MGFIDETCPGPVLLNEHGMLTGQIGDIAVEGKGQTLHLVRASAEPSITPGEMMIGSDIVIHAPEIGVVVIDGGRGSRPVRAVNQRRVRIREKCQHLQRARSGDCGPLCNGWHSSSEGLLSLLPERLVAMVPISLLEQQPAAG